MMVAVPTPPFASFAQNGEDVVLWRALGHIEHGRYVDVGANHPTDDSVTRAFYDHGWRGIAVEPVPVYAALFRKDRPEDHVVEAAITADSGDTITLHEVPDTGLSTLVDSVRDQHLLAGRDVRDITVKTRTLDDVLAEAGWDGSDVHFVSIDTEGGEEGVLRGFDLPRWRPWVLVIEATAPDSISPTYQAWEHVVEKAGYRFQLFDGLSRFYVAAEHEDELAAALGHGASILDNYTTLRQRNLESTIQRLHEGLRNADENLAQAKRDLAQATDDVVEWRSAALTRWADSVAAASQQTDSDEAQHLRDELAAVRATVSWRVTKPLRAVRGRIGSDRATRG